MRRYVIDVNLPYYFELWRSEEYIHQIDIDPTADDQSIWEYAKEHNLTIVTKDSDFSNRILITEPPPRVIHIKFGNMRMKEFREHVYKHWDEILEMSRVNKLVNVYRDKLEGID